MNKKVVILGGGESGVGAALLAQKEGFDVWLSDNGKINDRFKRELVEQEIAFEESGHDLMRIFDADIVVKSPGIPDTVPMIKELGDKNIPVISEIEFAGRFYKGKTIAITGSNGKTTTTMLLGHLLKTAGLNAVVGGNVGVSFARITATKDVDIIALELSSFQLDGIIDFRPDIAMILNVTPDHLDRYDYRMSRYVASKFRIAMNQQLEDLLLLNAEDKESRDFDKSAIKSTIEMLSREEFEHSSFSLSSAKLWGAHNEMNALFAVRAAWEMGVSTEVIQAGLNSFIPVEHRTETVAEIDGVLFVNDSKATNVDATYYALVSARRPIVWIVGGQDKGNDYSQLQALVDEKVKAIVCLGIDNKKLVAFFSKEGRPIVETKSAQEAVEQARQFAESGDMVLLSPACASFDLFKNYEERGQLFKKAVLSSSSQEVGDL